MISPQAVRDYVKAEPFRPFQINMASGKAHEVGHPEMIKILKNYVIVFKAEQDPEEFPEEFQPVSLMLSESLSHLEAPAR